jgi:hypothetical protein
VAFALVEKKTLHRDAAERRQVHDVGVLDAVAEAAARGNQRILQREKSERCRQVHQCTSSSQAIRAASNTGPSMQDRTRCVWPSASRTPTTQL